MDTAAPTKPKRPALSENRFEPRAKGVLQVFRANHSTIGANMAAPTKCETGPFSRDRDFAIRNDVVNVELPATHILAPAKFTSTASAFSHRSFDNVPAFAPVIIGERAALPVVVIGSTDRPRLLLSAFKTTGQSCVRIAKLLKGFRGCPRSKPKLLAFVGFGLHRSIIGIVPKSLHTFAGSRTVFIRKRRTVSPSLAHFPAGFVRVFSTLHVTILLLNYL